MISLQPANTIGNVGMNVTFTTAATSSGALHYQWRRNGADLPGSTESTLVIPTVTRAAEGFYDVVVSDLAGSTTSTAASLAVSPSSYPTAVTVDPTLDLRLESDVSVKIMAIVPLPDGGAMIGGAIASAQGERRSLVTRLNADGSLNTSFVPPYIAGDYVDHIDVLPDGRVFITGRFFRIGKVPQSWLARLNADGSLDQSFNPQLPREADFRSAAAQSDGKVVVTLWFGPDPVIRLNADGSFDRTLIQTAGAAYVTMVPGDKVYVTYSTASNENILARLNADGTRDPTFQPDASAIGDASVLATDARGRVYVRGTGSAFTGANRAPLARLGPDGTLDRSFSPQLTSYGSTGVVYCAAVQQDGRVLVGGVFDNASGLTSRSVARLNEDGTLASAFPTDVRANAVAVAQLKDGKILLGLDAGLYNNSTPLRTGLVRYNSDATLDAGFDLHVHGPGHPGPLLALSNGQYLVFGQFDHAGGVPTAGIVRLKRDGTVDKTFKATATIAPYFAVVYNAVELPDHRIAIVGDFRSVGGASRSGFAILNSDGTIDRTFVPAEPFYTVTAVGQLPGNRLVVAGYQANGLGGVAAFQPDGSVDPAFGQHINLQSYPQRLAVLGDGSVVVIGSVYKGTSGSELVHFKPDGTAEEMLDPNANWNVPSDLAIGPDGWLYVSGRVVLPDGTAVSIARFNAAGTLDTQYRPTVSEPIAAIVVQPDGKVIARAVGGTFGNPPHLYRFDPAGALDPTLVPVAIAAPYYTPRIRQALIMRDDGQLLMSDGAGDVGQFYATCPGLAPEILKSPASATVAAGADTTLHLEVNSASAETYQWALNGTNIPGATNGSYSLTDFSAGAVGNYTVVVSNAFGTTSTTATLSAPRFTAGRLANLSIRTVAGGDAGHLIVGYTLGGTATAGTKPVLLRGVGPGLAQFGITGLLEDPTMELYDGASHLIDLNDDWRGVFPFGSVGAFPLPANTKDAAIYNPFATAGRASFHVFGKGAAQGVVIAEAYDTSSPDNVTVFTPRLINGSARSNVGSGDNTLILGFVVVGDTPERVLVRAAGPTLGVAPFNIGGVVADPKLEVYAVGGAKLSENDNWEDNGAHDAMAAAFQSVSAFGFQPGSKDSAVILTLAPGGYSAVVRGVGGATGAALVELYELP